MSNPVELSEKRCFELESKVAELENALDATNRTAFRQEQRIDLLMQQIQALASQIRTISDEGETRNLRDEIPPHY